MITIESIMNAVGPEDIFSKENIKDEYRKLALAYHPDKCADPRCTDVFIKLDKLYKLGLDKIRKDYWDTYGILKLNAITGKPIIIKYKYRQVFALGWMYVGDNHVTFVVGKAEGTPQQLGYRKLFVNFRESVGSLRFGDANMQDEFSKFLPKIKMEFETRDQFVLVLDKTEDVIPLNVALQYYNGVMDPKHVAWIVSSLLNLRCFLQFNDMAHNDISLDTYFISPTWHSGLLLGGWWYSAKNGSKLKGLPNRTYTLTATLNAKKTANLAVDGELIKDVARTLLGDPVGLLLEKKFNVPKSFAKWVRLPGSGSAIEEYKHWMRNIIIESFGERKFTEMDINIDAAYKKCQIIN